MDMKRTPKDMAIGAIYKTNYFGELKVTGYGCNDKAIVTFIDTGFECEVAYRSIRIGEVRDLLSPAVHGVGFIGSGKYNQSCKGKQTKEYQRWVNMISRCYSDNVHKRQPTYKDCTVHTDRHNFQNFAKWSEENYPDDGMVYELDKDIKIDGNKIYSPDTCVFVSKSENRIHSGQREYKMISPSGEVVEIKNMTKFCIDMGLSRGCMHRVAYGGRKSHKGWRLASA